MQESQSQVQETISPKPVPVTEEIIDGILADAHREPKEFVDSWEVPGGAE